MSVRRFKLGESDLHSFKTIPISEMDIKASISDLLNNLRDITYENLMKEGVGTANNQTPSGGVPVWQGDPLKTTYYPGALRDGHNKESNGLLHKAITVNEYLFYAPAVINGHSRSPPNRYHERALNETPTKQITKKHISNLRQKWLNYGFE